DAPGHGQQRRGRVRRVGVDQQEVLVRRRPGCIVWIGQGGFRGGWSGVICGVNGGPGAIRSRGQHTCPCFRAASNMPRSILPLPCLRAAPVRDSPILRLSGSITALATPFTVAGELDLDAWRRLLHAQLAGGTQALVVAGSTGEAAALSDAEYDTLL